MGRINRPEFSARQAVLLHCMENPDLAERIDWQNPQVCATAASITALCKVWENISDDMVSQKNDYPTLSDFRVTESGKVESEMPLYAISKQRDEPRNADEKEGFEKEFWHLGDRDYRIRFSGSLDDAKNMDEENVSVNSTRKERTKKSRSDRPVREKRIRYGMVPLFSVPTELDSKRNSDIRISLPTRKECLPWQTNNSRPD